LTRPKQYGLAQGGIAMNSSFQINIYHGTFLKNLSYWVLVPDKHLSWNFSGKFKLLGISFNLSESDKTLENFTEKVQSVKTILNLWSYRHLTYSGKVTVIKTLALPILVQCLTVLPNPPDSILNDI
jgi:hypothetical protein